MEVEEFIAGLNELVIILNALQNFPKDQIGKPKALPRELAVKPIILSVPAPRR